MDIKVFQDEDIFIDENSDKITFTNSVFNNVNIINDGKRVLFYQCEFNTANPVMGGTGFAVFYKCRFNIKGNFLSKSIFKPDRKNRLKGLVFLESEFFIDELIKTFYITRGNSMITLLNNKFNTSEETHVIWTEKDVEVKNFYYAQNTYQSNESLYIERSDEAAFEIAKEAIPSFNPYNMLRGEDEYDPLNIRNLYNEKDLDVFYIETERNKSVVSGEKDALLKMFAHPIDAKINFLVESSEDVSIKLKEYNREKHERNFSLNGINFSDELEYRYITFTMDNGLKAETLLEIKPSIIEPPRFLETPIITIENGEAYLDYELNLSGREDMSEISWYRVDKKDRSYFEDFKMTLKSNEMDCRKIAVSRNSKPCKKLKLSINDVGKHLKVNIKPKHIRSNAGSGLNIMSRIIKASDIIEDKIIYDFQNVVLGSNHEIENGYLTPKGIWKYDKLKSGSAYGMVPESEKCAFYYQDEKPVTNMSVYLKLAFENKNGALFSVEEDIFETYIKYNYKEKSGYGIRFTAVNPNKNKVALTLYKYDRGSAYPVSESMICSNILMDTEIFMEIQRNKLKVMVISENGKYQSETLMAEIGQSSFNGTGLYFSGTVKEGYRFSLKKIEIKYSE